MNARIFTTLMFATVLPMAQAIELSEEARSAALQKALEVMAIAKDNQKREAALEKIRSAEADAKASGILDKVKSAVANGEEINSIDSIKNRAIGDARVQSLISGASPQAAALIAAGQAAKPAPKPPKPPAPATKPVALPDPILVPTAQAETTTSPVEADTGTFDPSKVAPPERKVRNEKTVTIDEDKQIIITCDDVAYFDAKARIAIFEGNVKVDHPGFDLECDKLEVFFKPESAAKPAPAEGAAPASGESGTGEIDKVIATGRMVRIEKPASTGEMQIGQCKKAIFYADSENIEMYIWPQVQKGQYRMTATEESTVIKIDQNGGLEALGQTTSGFEKGEKKK